MKQDKLNSLKSIAETAIASCNAARIARNNGIPYAGEFADVEIIDILANDLKEACREIEDLRIIHRTKLNIGDAAFVIIQGKPFRATVGMVRLERIDSPGIPGEMVFNNYMPQTRREERYMCVETGIGSGSVYTYGVHIWKTLEECETFIALPEEEKLKIAESNY